MDFLDTVKGLLSPELVSTAASQLGESETGVRKAMDVALPAVLGGVANKLQEGGNTADGIFSLLKSAGSSGLMNSVGSLMPGLGGGANTTATDTSGNLLSMLFGSQLSSLTSAIGTQAGVSAGSASSLLGMGSTLVAGFLGNRINTDGLSLSGLTGMLASQSNGLMGTLPGGLGGMLGGLAGGITGAATGVGSLASGAVTGAGNLASDAAAGVGNLASGAAAGVGNVASGLGNAASGAMSSLGNAASGATSMYSDEDGKKGGLGIWGWLIPVLLVAALAFFLLRGCNNKPVTTGLNADSLKNGMMAASDSMAAGAGAAAGAVGDAASSVGAAADSLGADVKAKFDALGPKVGVKLPDGTTLNVPEKGVEGQLVKFLLDPATKSMTADQLKGKWFDFDRILFDTGKSTIRAASQEQIDNIAMILKAFPTLKLKFGGYTDNTGGKASNVKLSGDRAKAVMMAVATKDKAEARLSSEGYGPEHPVADNATAEGREKNRRVSVRIVSL